ncbi:MAG: ATP-binding protein [Promethearchaeota archaeon]
MNVLEIVPSFTSLIVYIIVSMIIQKSTRKLRNSIKKNKSFFILNFISVFFVLLLIMYVISMFYLINSKDEGIFPIFNNVVEIIAGVSFLVFVTLTCIFIIARIHNLSLKNEKLINELVSKEQFKSEFMATMSHELRTPLNAIIGFAELILEGMEDDVNPDVLSLIKDIHSSAEDMLELITRTLEISKLDCGDLYLDIKPVVLNDIIRQVLNKFNQRIREKNLNLIVKGMKESIVAYLDPIHYKRVIENILDNAIKYTDHGSITVSIRQSDTDVIVDISDTGKGIDKKDFGKIMEEFKQASSGMYCPNSALGLGLAFSNRIIELHGGSLTFTSEVNVGTTFTIKIPKKQLNLLEKEGSMFHISKRERRLEGNYIKILIIEDVKSDMLAIKGFLENIRDFKVDILWCKKVRDAIDIINHHNFDVILLDLYLPDSEGINTIIKLIDHAKEIPIIVLTMKDDDDFAVAAIQNGAQDYLIKSKLSPERLLRSIKCAIERFKLISRYRELLDLYKSIFNKISHPVFTNILAENFVPGEFIDANESLCKLLGYEKQNILELEFFDVISPRYKKYVKSIIETLNKNDYLEYKIDLINKDGEIIPVSLNSHIVFFNNRPIILTCVQRVITKKLLV